MPHSWVLACWHLPAGFCLEATAEDLILRKFPDCLKYQLTPHNVIIPTSGFQGLVLVADNREERRCVSLGVHFIPYGSEPGKANCANFPLIFISSASLQKGKLKPAHLEVTHLLLKIGAG